jgi:lactoylglutathione lyase
MKIYELNHTALHVSNVERSRDFYSRVLKLEAIPRPAFDFPGAWFRLGTQQELHLISRPENPIVEPRTRDNHFALRVDDIHAWEKHLQTTGVEFRPPKKRPDGATQIFLLDPDGHCLELFTPPGV